MINLQKIRDLCKKNRITLKRLAEDIEMTDAGVQYILNNNTTSLDNLYKIASYFKVHIGYFFDEEPESISSINQVANGHGNKQSIEIDQQYKKIMRLEFQIDSLKDEVKALKEQLKLKNEIIELLKK